MPPCLTDLQIVILLILSGFWFHTNLNNILFNSLKKLSEGLGNVKSK